MSGLLKNLFILVGSLCYYLDGCYLSLKKSNFLIKVYIEDYIPKFKFIPKFLNRQLLLILK